MTYSQGKILASQPCSSDEYGIVTSTTSPVANSTKGQVRQAELEQVRPRLTGLSLARVVLFHLAPAIA